MNTRQLRTFVAAATQLNFTRAAEAVNLAPSSVSEQIQALEIELGTPLFDRSRRELKLTSAGESFLDYAREIVALAREAHAAAADAAGVDGTSIEVGALESLAAFWLPPFLSTLRATHPGIAVNVQVASSKALRDAVERGDVDVALGFDSPSADSGLSHRIVDETPLVAVIPATHPAADADGIALADLANEPLIATAQGCVYRTIFDQAFAADVSRRPVVASEVGSVAAIVRMVAARMGSAVVPRIAVTQVAGAVLLPISDLPSLPIVMSWRRRRVVRPALRDFLAQAAASGHGSDQPMAAVDMHDGSGREAVA